MKQKTRGLAAAAGRVEVERLAAASATKAVGREQECPTSSARASDAELAPWLIHPRAVTILRPLQPSTLYARLDDAPTLAAHKCGWMFYSDRPRCFVIYSRHLRDFSYHYTLILLRSNLIHLIRPPSNSRPPITRSLFVQRLFLPDKPKFLSALLQITPTTEQTFFSRTRSLQCSRERRNIVRGYTA